MSNTYAIVDLGKGQYAVTKNGRTIVLSATKQPMPFATTKAAQAFITIQIAADDRHATPYGK